jgi:hypothetical protein
MGLDKISVTLYDLLGYVLPGFLLLLACSIIEAAFGDSSLFAISEVRSNTVLALVTAYFLGQTSHALASRVSAKEKHRLRNGSYQLGDSVTRRISETLIDTFKIEQDPNKPLSHSDMLLLADGYILASGGSVERDVLMAREGFFKSSAVAFALVGVVNLAVLLFSDFRLQTEPRKYVSLSYPGAVGLTVVMFLLSWIFLSRYRFFNCVKRNNILLTFLALRHKPPAEESGRRSADSK